MSPSISCFVFLLLLYVPFSEIAKDSPAAKSNLKVGDRILKVNGVLANGWTPEQAAQALGVPGQTVSLVVSTKQKSDLAPIETRDMVGHMVGISRVNPPVLSSLFLLFFSVLMSFSFLILPLHRRVQKGLGWESPLCTQREPWSPRSPQMALLRPRGVCLWEI